MLSHISFGKGKKEIAILIPTADFKKDLLNKHYVTPLVDLGIDPETIIAFNIEKNDQGKAPVSIIKPCLNQIKKFVEKEKIKTILVCDSNYFKVLCKQRKTESSYGYPLDTIWKEKYKAFLCPNFRSLFYNPSIQSKIDFSLQAIVNHAKNKVGVFDRQILLDCEYPSSIKEISECLNKYSKLPMLSADIETYSLKVNEAGLATITFCKNETTGFAFGIGNDSIIRQLLKDFFINYTGTLIWHGSTYDCKIIIWELFMKHPRDIQGMLEGLHIMFRNIEDTKILAYLALNSTSKVKLDLKSLAFQYTGNYALENIEDISKHSPQEILTYNITDGIATWYVYNKYRKQVKDTQENVYQNVFLPALKVLTQTELCGVPLNLGQVLITERNLQDISKLHYDAIMNNPIVVEVTQKLREIKAVKDTTKLKKKVKTADDYLNLQFNPNSDAQLAYLLHTHMQLPILAKTPTGQPSTKGKVLKALIVRINNSKQWKNTSYAELINHIIELHDADKILTTFIPAFKNNSINKDGWNYLHGNFNLGGTVSGRLSSSEPNLTNIPSGGTQYGKAVKQCFQLPYVTTEKDPKGWLLVGADYFSLEDRISALQTKDPQKLKIYTDGMDGHCSRAYYYFKDKMPDIDPTNVESINSIEEKYPDLRKLSKGPTFLLTYMGTYKGLMQQFGFTEEIAKKIEANYHDLYAVSDQWVMDEIRKASDTGYVELAFGLRLRTPILPQVILDSDVVPYEAHKEIKTAGNALGQSYGLLNTRSANEFMERVWNSKFATKVLPSMQIHDAQYYMIENTLECVKWVNDNLIECMEWNKLPAIQHPTITLGGQLEIYYPNWSTPIKIPNKASIEEIQTILKEY